MFEATNCMKGHPGRLAKGLLAGALVLGTSDARADESEEYPFVEAAAGIGLSTGRHEYSTVDYPGQPASESLGGPAVDFTITPAYGFRNLSVGVAFDAVFITSDDCAAVASASGVAMLRHVRPGFLGMLALGYASGGRLCFKIRDSGTDTHIADGGTGPRFATSFGYQWSSGFGFETTASYAYLWSEYSRYQPLTIVLQAILSGR